MKSISKVQMLIWMVVLCVLASPVFAKKKSHHKTYSKQTEIEAPRSGTIWGKQNLIQEINRIVSSSMDGKSAIGVQIKSMQYGDTLYTCNENRTFVPASILKILTAESALLYLGPNYKFTTNFATDAKSVKNGVVHGNVYLIHSGDPTLTYYDIEDLMTFLHQNNIRRIEGNIYIDSSAYDQEIYAPGWVWNDRRFCYAAPISASIINHNCLNFQIAPGKAPGYFANLIEGSGFSSGYIQNNVITKPAGSRSCVIRLGSENNMLVVSGCMPKGRYKQGVTTVVTDVIDYNRMLLAKLFSRFNIQYTGAILSGVAPANLTNLAVHESKPLHELITEMLKKSDNIIAGSLFKKMGAIHSKRPGSWQNGSNAVRQILTNRVGMNAGQMNITDGSGLSRFNQITPAQMMSVLDFAFHHQPTNYEFISALPVAGVDGTLKRRLYNVAWKVRAKTGTMKGVVSLAGYAINRNKEPIAFVIIFNGKNGTWKYRSLEDKIVTALTRYTRVG